MTKSIPNSASWSVLRPWEDRVSIMTELLGTSTVSDGSGRAWLRRTAVENEPYPHRAAQ